MSQQARTYLHQAQAASEGGEPGRALELLRRAKATAGEDRSLMIRILVEMVRIAPLAECATEGEIWQKQLTRLRPNAPAPRVGSGTESGAPRAAESSGLKFIAFAIFGCVLIAAGGWGFWHWSAAWYARKDLPEVSKPISAVAGSSSIGESSAATLPLMNAASERQQRLTDNVGLVVWIQRYEGLAGSPACERVITWEIPLGIGTAFAVNNAGIMLTNRHVAAPAIADQPDQFGDGITLPALRRSGAPFMMVCFGADPDQQFRATVAYQSQVFDVAVLEVPHRFEHPLNLARRMIAKTEPVVAHGFPDSVISASQFKNQAYLLGQLEKAARSGKWSFADQFPPDVFDAVATRGIVSAPNRSFDGILYHMFDAKSGPGNSGGPLLAQDSDEVVGIVTLAQFGNAGDPVGYNYALALPQVRSELSKYLP